MAPTTLTAAWVTSPARINVIPNAAMNGHAVGAGTRIEFESFSLIALTTDHVDYGEHHDPYCIHEVPIPRQKFEATGLPLHASSESKDEREEQQRQAEGDVTRVQTDQRVEGCPE